MNCYVRAISLRTMLSYSAALNKAIHVQVSTQGSKLVKCNYFHFICISEELNWQTFKNPWLDASLTCGEQQQATLQANADR